MSRPERSPRPPRQLLVDTGVWLGFLHARDQNHDAATSLIRDAVTQKTTLLVTNLILAEAQRLLLHRVGRGASHRFLDRLEASRALRMVFATKTHHEAALRWLLELADQRLTYTDAVSFALLEASPQMRVATFDSDFVVAGFTPWLGPARETG